MTTVDLYLLGIVGGFAFGGFRVLLDTTVPLVLAVLGPLLPQDIDAVIELLP